MNSKLSSSKSKRGNKNITKTPLKINGHQRLTPNKSKEKAKKRSMKGENFIKSKSKSKPNNQDNNSNNNLLMNNSITSFEKIIDEKSIDEESCSTFFFTGDNYIDLDNNNVLEQFLKNSKIPKGNSNLKQIMNKLNNLSSLSSNGNRTKENKKIIEKPIECNKDIKANKLRNLTKKSKNIKKKNANTLYHLKYFNVLKPINKFLDKIKIENKYKILFLVLINIGLYIFTIAKVFEPSIKSLFANDDHFNYIYISNRISDDTTVARNNE